MMMKLIIKTINVIISKEKERNEKDTCGQVLAGRMVLGALCGAADVNKKNNNDGRADEEAV